jgi:hypothetical protein
MLQAITDASAAPVPIPAITLLGDAEQYSKTLLEFAVGPEAVRELKTISWDGVGFAIYEPSGAKW